MDPENGGAAARRRRVVIFAVLGAVGVNLWFALKRILLPGVKPAPATFSIGRPSEFSLGVHGEFLRRRRIWIVRRPEELFVIHAVCTHKGCTPGWRAAEGRFKCLCHGSIFDVDGVNLQGPAPRPLERAHVELNPRGEIVVDLGRLYGRPQFQDTGARIRIV